MKHAYLKPCFATMGILLVSGCAYAPGGNSGPSSDASELRTDRMGAADQCSFSARGAVTEAYGCGLLAVMADGSSATGVSTLTFSPTPGAETPNGVVQFAGAALTAGSYELSDLKMANFSLKAPQALNPTWLCQAGAGTPTVGALKIKITSAQAVTSIGPDTNYAVHGVFEALLIPVDGKASGTTILHGEF